MLGLLAAVPIHAGLAFPSCTARCCSRPPRVALLDLRAGPACTRARTRSPAGRPSSRGPLQLHRASRHEPPAGGHSVFRRPLRRRWRCARADPLVAQRARILLAGCCSAGRCPRSCASCRRPPALHVLDIRVAYWSVSILLLALARTDAAPRAPERARRRAARRASTGRRSARSRCSRSRWSRSLPTWWRCCCCRCSTSGRSFEALLNAWLYPQRLRLPEIVRKIGEDMAAATDAQGVLDVLAQAADAARRRARRLGVPVRGRRGSERARARHGDGTHGAARARAAGAADDDSAQRDLPRPDRRRAAVREHQARVLRVLRAARRGRAPADRCATAA